jgi:hypothetical protein
VTSEGADEVARELRANDFAPLPLLLYARAAAPASYAATGMLEHAGDGDLLAFVDKQLACRPPGQS